MLNCDWFQPFDHSTYSLVAIYIAIQNLPRHLRFKSENIGVGGIIPGPKEPLLMMNTYIQPIIDHLLQLWNGVEMEIDGKLVVVYAILSCISCDIPASHKIGGFVGHNALHGCSRCLKEFPVAAFGWL